MSEFDARCPEGLYVECSQTIFSVEDVATVLAGQLAEPLTEVSLSDTERELALDTFAPAINGFKLDLLRNACAVVAAVPCADTCPMALEIDRLQKLQEKK